MFFFSATVNHNLKNFHEKGSNILFLQEIEDLGQAAPTKGSNQGIPQKVVWWTGNAQGLVRYVDRSIRRTTVALE